MSTDDEGSRPGIGILLAGLACVLVTGAAVAAQLLLAGPWRYPCAAVTAAAPLLLVRPVSGPLHAWLARRRTLRARHTADSLRLEQLHERAVRRPPVRVPASAADAAHVDDADGHVVTASTADPDTRSIDLDALTQ